MRVVNRAAQRRPATRLTAPKRRARSVLERAWRMKGHFDDPITTEATMSKTPSQYATLGMLMTPRSDQAGS